MMNKQVMEKIDPEMLSDEVMETMTDSFKALGDPTRLRIMALLFNGERTVGDLAGHLAVSQSAVSHQLRLLRNLDIVRHRKDGREVYYALADDHIRDIYTRTLEHILIE